MNMRVSVTPQIGLATPSTPLQQTRGVREGTFQNVDAAALAATSEAILGFTAELNQQVERQEGYQAAVDFARLDTELSIDALESLRSLNEQTVPTYAKDRTDSVTQKTNQFLGNIPPRLRDQYNARVVALQGKYALTDLQTQFDATDEIAGRQLGQQVNQMLSDVYQNPGNTQEALSQLNILLEEYPNQAEVGALRERLETEILLWSHKGQQASGLIDSQGGSTYKAKARSVESGGDPNARNPSSSATGPYQFIDSTWLGLFNDVFPNHQFLSETDKLALRTDERFAGPIMDEFTNRNTRALVASGFRPTDTNLYLAHFLGSDGALKVLNAAPGTNIRDIVPSGVRRANKAVFRNIRTRQDLLAWAGRKMQRPVAENEIYNRLPIRQRVGNAVTGRGQQNASTIAEGQRAQAAQDGIFADAQAQIVANQVGPEDIAALAPILGVDRANQLRNDYNNWQKLQENELSLYDKLASGALFTAQDQQLLDDRLRTPAGEDILGQIGAAGENAQQLMTDEINLAQKTGLVGRPLTDTLTAMIQSGNQRLGTFALNNVAQLADVAPYNLGMDKGLVRRATEYRNALKYIDDPQARDDVYQRLFPRFMDSSQRAAFEAQREAADTEFRENIPAPDNIIDGVLGRGVFSRAIAGLDPSGFIGTDRPKLPALTNNSHILQQDTKDMYMVASQLFPEMTHEQKLEKAYEYLSESWGTSEVAGDPVFMRHPPEAVQRQLGVRGLTTDEMQEDLRALIPPAYGQPMYLMSDVVTDSQVSQGLPPSYLVVVKQPGTQHETILSMPTANNGELQPYRVFFDMNQEHMQKRNDSLALEQAELDRQDIARELDILRNQSEAVITSDETAEELEPYIQEQAARLNALDLEISRLTSRLNIPPAQNPYNFGTATELEPPRDFSINPITQIPTGGRGTR